MKQTFTFFFLICLCFAAFGQTECACCQRKYDIAANNFSICDYEEAWRWINYIYNTTAYCPNDCAECYPDLYNLRSNISTCRQNPNAEVCPCRKVQEPDSDGDGIVDSKDNCKYEKGTAQYNGCPPPPPPPPAVVTDNFVFVQGGSFTMGCTSEQGSDCGESEKPAHTVTVSNFYMTKYEITNQEYCTFLNAKGNQTEEGYTWLDIADTDCRIEQSNGRFQPKSGYADHPVVEVTWYGAKAYCDWLGNGARLPTEAEWEYAARSSTGSLTANNYKYAGSNILDEVAWYTSNSSSSTHPVGQKKANALGLYDISGNVWEWCADWYDSGYYEKSKNATNPKNETSASYKVLRGGSWSSVVNVCRVSNRFNLVYPSVSYDSYGFRVVR